MHSNNKKCHPFCNDGAASDENNKIHQFELLSVLAFYCLLLALKLALNKTSHNKVIYKKNYSAAFLSDQTGNYTVE